MTTPPSYKKVNPADSPILLLTLRSDTHPAGHGRRIRRPVPGPADFAGPRRRPGLDLRRPHALDPRPDRSGQARQQRADAGGHPRRRSSARPPTAPKGTHQHRRRPSFTIAANDQITKAEHVQRRHHRLSQRRADPGPRRRPGGGRPGRPQRRGLPEQQGRHHPRGVQAARRQRRRHRRSDQGADPAAHRAHPAGDRGPHPARPHHDHPRLGARTSSSRSASPSRWWSW